MRHNLAQADPRHASRAPAVTTLNRRTPMATRQQHAASADRKAARSAALATLTGEPLPLPSPRRTSPADYTPDLPDELIALGAAGLTETQIADHLALSADGLASMAKAHPAVADALSRARTAAKAWWEEQARRALITENNRFPAGAWAQVMKARFADYDDKPSLVLDLSNLVVIQRARPEPLHKRTADDANPLIEGETIQPRISLTGPDQPQVNLSGAATVDAHHDNADPQGAGGVGAKTGPA